MYVLAKEISNILGLSNGENFPKLDIDTCLDLCYINNKSLHGLFCKNVHVFVIHVAYDKAAFLFAHVGASPCPVSQNQNGVTVPETGPPLCARFDSGCSCYDSDAMSTHNLASVCRHAVAHSRQRVRDVHTTVTTPRVTFVF